MTLRCKHAGSLGCEEEEIKLEPFGMSLPMIRNGLLTKANAYWLAVLENPWNVLQKLNQRTFHPIWLELNVKPW